MSTASIRKKILLIERDPDVRAVFCELLSYAGYEPIAAGTLQDGLNQLMSPELPAAILYDCPPPCYEGRDFFIGRKTLGRELIPVLFLCTDKLVREKYASEDVTSFIPMPVDLDVFLSTLEKIAA